MNTTVVLLAAAFGFLSPQDAQKQNVKEANDPRHDFQAFGMDAGGIAVRRLPSGNLRHTWNELGVKIYKRVDWDDEGSPEHYRRELGFAPFMRKADGVVLDRAPSKLPDDAKQALAAAKDDVMLLERLAELAKKCEKSDNHLIRIEARRVLYFFSDTDVSLENVDTLRLDTLENIRRLEFLLGEKDGGYEKYYKLPKLAAARPFKPYAGVKPLPEGFKAKTSGEMIELAPGFRFNFDAKKGSFGFYVDNPNGKLDKGRVADDYNNFTVKLTIPGAKKGEWSSIKYRFDSKQLPDAKRAPQEGSSFMAVRIEDRFESGVPVIATIPNRDWSRTYPKLVANGKLEKGAKGGWTASATFSTLSLFDNLPMTREEAPGKGIVDVWYLEIDKLPDGTGPVVRRVSFPKGSKQMRQTLWYKNFNVGAFSGLYLRSFNEMNDLVARARSERHYPFLPSPTFHLFAPDSDVVFQRNVVQPMVADYALLCDALWSDKAHPHPKLVKMNDAKRAAVLDKADKLAHFFEDVSAARRDYVLMRRRGETPEAPKPKAKKESATIKAPDMDAEGSDDVSLDEDI